MALTKGRGREEEEGVELDLASLCSMPRRERDVSSCAFFKLVKDGSVV